MRRASLAVLAILVAVLVPLSFSLAAADVKFVDPGTLKSWLGAPDLLLIDVRPPEAWSEATTKIKGAVRGDPGEDKVAVWGKDLPHDKKIVLYWDFDIPAARVARQLMGMGVVNVMVLRGGWNEWLKLGYPVEPKGQGEGLVK